MIQSLFLHKHLVLYLCIHRVHIPRRARDRREHWPRARAVSPHCSDDALDVAQHERALALRRNAVARLAERQIVPVDDNHADHAELLQLREATADGRELGVGEWALDLD